MWERFTAGRASWGNAAQANIREQNKQTSYQ